jgi:hypothetical protein
MKITAALLVKHNACPDQVKIFRRVFPHGAMPTLANLRKARRATLDVFFLEGILRWSVLAEYDKVRGPALAEYDKVCGPALAESEKVCGLVLVAALAEDGTEVIL